MPTSWKSLGRWLFSPVHPFEEVVANVDLLLQSADPEYQLARAEWTQDDSGSGGGSLGRRSRRQRPSTEG